MINLKASFKRRSHLQRPNWQKVKEKKVENNSEIVAPGRLIHETSIPSASVGDGKYHLCPLHLLTQMDPMSFYQENQQRYTNGIY